MEGGDAGGASDIIAPERQRFCPSPGLVGRWAATDNDLNINTKLPLAHGCCRAGCKRPQGLVKTGVSGSRWTNPASCR